MQTERTCNIVSDFSMLICTTSKIPEGLIQIKIPRMHYFAQPGNLPESCMVCTQGRRQIGQAGRP